MLVLLTLAIWFPLTLNEGKDLALARAGAPLDDLLGSRPEGTGAVQMYVRYRVPSHRLEGFVSLLNDLRMTRLRNGASGWRLEPGGETSDGHSDLTERVIFPSWQEYTRFHSRTTRWDQMLEALAREYHVGTEPPSAVTEEMRRGFAVPPKRTTVEGSAAPTGQSIQLESSGAETRPAMQMQERVTRGIDRAIDELFLVYDRISKPGVKRDAGRNGE